MSKITNSPVRQEFPHLFILRNDDAFKTELAFMTSLMEDQTKASAVLRYAFASERLMYIGFQLSVADDQSAWEEENLSEDLEHAGELSPSSEWEKEANREMAEAKIELARSGLTTEFVDALKLNGTTMEEIFTELKRERVQIEQSKKAMEHSQQNIALLVENNSNGGRAIRF